ncbi:PAAR domain-containing protein [Providencia stuartii]|uniref:PAAR domain-containing protein n=1 Tax=Providencia stuartii TaxID=588 RepID=UPI000CE67A90|nr:hypothetical protein AM353_03055 [Providencia stuartii]
MTRSLELSLSESITFVRPSTLWIRDPVVGDQVSCPKCKGIYAIVEGSATMKYNGKSLALEGMKTACGATLIASQSSITGK